MRRAHQIALTAVLVVAGAALALARADVKVQKDDKFDFTALKTFEWNSTPGDVRIWVSKDSNAKAEPAKRKYEPVLMQAVEEQMVLRGYAKVAAGAAPDFRMTYYVLIVAGETTQQMGQFLPTNATWGIPLWGPSTTQLDLSPQGSIVLDISSPTPNDIRWRGAITAKVETMISDAERAKRVQGFMKDLVAKFPKRK